MTMRAAAALLLGALLLGCSDDDEGTSATSAIGGDSPATTAPVTEESTAAGAGDEATTDICAFFDEIRARSEAVETRVAGALQEALGAAASGQAVDQGAVLDGLRAGMAEIEADLDEVTALYDQGIAAAPPDVAEDLRQVRDGTVALLPRFTEAVEGVEGFEDVQGALEGALADPDVAALASEAGAAALRVDEYSVPECGVQFSS